MASRPLDIRWMRKPRYKKLIIVGGIVFTLNVCLVHVLVKSYRDPLLEPEDPSGRGKSFVEVSYLPTTKTIPPL